jgi:hypothetical protein
MKKWLRSQLIRLPPAKGLKAELDSLKKPFPPGHFYSPIPNLQSIRQNHERIFNRNQKQIPGIDLREDQQLELLQRLLPFYKEQPFPENKSDEFRYYLSNTSYTYSDGLLLYAMIRMLAPKRIIEIGSGNSSALIMDVNQRYFQNSIACTFIEPYPKLLREIADPLPGKSVLIEKELQNVPMETFMQLEANDILFIDSTHVTKTGSDVNIIFFEVLPAIKRNVFIHFHDIFFPFEYPENWVYEGFAWNEDYLLRAFLMYNTDFEIVLFNTYLEQFHTKWFEDNMPLCLKNRGGSLWIRKC